LSAVPIERVDDQWFGALADRDGAEAMLENENGVGKGFF
jgi:hypothetical protein